jgi:hypothetical protein
MSSNLTALAKYSPTLLCMADPHRREKPGIRAGRAATPAAFAHRSPKPNQAADTLRGGNSARFLVVTMYDGETKITIPNPVNRFVIR